jgi:hypothetical protein
MTAFLGCYWWLSNEMKWNYSTGVDAMNVHKYCFMSLHKYESRLILLAYTNIYKFGENAKL